ncbi:capsular exopolysaccharide synthesis family protein [Roseimicrobium gellanilyticum]|uniref:Capsular exopolysaccharide synthesis family protein n=1 Tax=Roseimicrobium gellanilyticum TaxID=748857 RepID=A0A366HAG0_9BACT|nr:polysaccharide biosynthesis tyrosine autokinase [Roseimicrobium gellanilyticum]RBP38676.1 capsular exopolysaccharide synthesis family protein [Roseimicrobium gellanilyticum]
MATPNNLELQRHALDYWQIIRNRLGLILASFIFIFAVAAVLTYIMPRKFRGRVEMVIERKLDDARVVGNANLQDDNLASTDSFLKTQFEIITKRRTLDRVVDKLDLLEKWNLKSKQAAAGKLIGNLDAQSSIKSDFITLDYYDEDPDLAALIANTIADSYKETRLETDNARINKAIEGLNIQIAAKELQAKQSMERMIQLKKDLDLVTLPTSMDAKGAQDDVMTPESAMLLDTQRDVATLQKQVRDLKAQHDQMMTLEGDELIRLAGEMKVENETIRRMGPTYQELLLKQQSLATAGLGRKHPTMRGIAGSLEQTRALLLEAAQDYRKNLGVRITTVERQLEEAEKHNKDTRAKSLDSQAGHHEYLAAKREWETLQQDTAKLKDTKAQKEIERDGSKTPITVYQPAEPDTTPSKPNVKLNLLLGGIIGLMFGFGMAFFLEYLDTSVRTMDDLERTLSVPVLAVVPKGVGTLMHATGITPDAEAYRILRTNLEFNRRDPNANCISVASGSPGEGKSTTMVNLATICAQGGYNTLIIDADMRRPRQHTFFNVPHTFGLSNYLSSNVPLEEVVVQTQVDHLYFMPSGVMPADSAGLLNSQKFVDLLTDVKSRFDLVLIDSPPIIGVSDASVLAAEADMTIIVVQHRKLPRQMLQRVKQTIEQVGGKVAGAVLNNVNINSDATYGYYTSYYGYYSGDGKGDGTMKAKRKTRQSTPAKGAKVKSPRAKADEVF